MRFAGWPLLLALAGSFPLAGCDSRGPGSTVRVTSDDLVGVWRIDFISGTSHPMVGGELELTDDDRILSLPSAGGDHGARPSFWHLLRTKSGHAIIAIDESAGEEPVLEKLDMPMAVTLDGDRMVWNLLMRHGAHQATPSDQAAYKFTRK